MGILKDVTQTVKNIFNADDDMMFEDEAEFSDGEFKNSGFSIQKPFLKKSSDSKNFSIVQRIPSFDVGNLSFDAAKNNGSTKGRSNGKIQVYVPKTFEEAFSIVKDVKAGFTAMVNVEIANPQISTRIIDIISGAIYALDGDCKKMGEKQYIFSLNAETIGAYDYLPVNGVPMSQQNNGFNFGMPQSFEYLNQNNQGQGMNNNFNPQVPNFGQQNFNPNNNQGYNTNNSFAQNAKNISQDLQKFYVPPKSQF